MLSCSTECWQFGGDITIAREPTEEAINEINHYMKPLPDSDEDIEKGLTESLNKDILVEAVIAQIKRGK